MGDGAALVYLRRTKAIHTLPGAHRETRCAGVRRSVPRSQGRGPKEPAPAEGFGARNEGEISLGYDAYFAQNHEALPDLRSSWKVVRTFPWSCDYQQGASLPIGNSSQVSSWLSGLGSNSYGVAMKATGKINVAVVGVGFETEFQSTVQI